MATIIRGDLAQLRTLAEKLEAGGRRIEEEMKTAERSFHALQASHWNGRHRGLAEDRWQQTNQRMRPLPTQASELAKRLRTFADRLETSASTLDSTNNGPATTNTADTTTQASEPAVPVASSGASSPAQPVPFAAKALPTGSTKTQVLSGLSGCTHYVASRVNLDDWNRWPNAEQWNDVARAKNYPVDQVPAQGSIMVFEKNTLHASASAGHVAYVESVSQNNNSYHVTISEANVPYDKNNNAIFGAHTPVKTRSFDFTVGADGVLRDAKGNTIPGVSFIHGK